MGIVVKESMIGQAVTKIDVIEIENVIEEAVTIEIVSVEAVTMQIEILAVVKILVTGKSNMKYF